MQELQIQIQHLLEKQINDSLEDGVQVAVYHRGKLVIHACAGFANQSLGLSVDTQTLFMSMSCAKAITATIIHRLVQAGKISYDDTIAASWPAFARHGKSKITLRQVLCHTAGIPQAPKQVDAEMVADWERMVREIENLKPLWEPGTRTGYHALTFGTILGEVARRVDGRPFARIVQEDICEPLGLVDELFFGVPQQAEPRIARVIGGKRLLLHWLPIAPLFGKAVPASLVPMGNPSWNQEKFQRAVIPSGPAVMTAHALARCYAALIGEVDGVRLLTASQLKEATTLQTTGPDKVLVGSTIPKALGYWLGKNSSAPAMGNNPHTFGHIGLGGLIGFADPARQLSFALMKNRLTFRDHDTDVLVAHAIRTGLDLQERKGVLM
jgi:CubicO group peptidase (beta-lactamase class C family)